MAARRRAAVCRSRGRGPKRAPVRRSRHVCRAARAVHARGAAPARGWASRTARGSSRSISDLAAVRRAPPPTEWDRGGAGGRLLHSHWWRRRLVPPGGRLVPPPGCGGAGGGEGRGGGGGSSRLGHESAGRQEGIGRPFVSALGAPPRADAGSGISGGRCTGLSSQASAAIIRQSARAGARTSMGYVRIRAAPARVGRDWARLRLASDRAAGLMKRRMAQLSCDRAVGPPGAKDGVRSRPRRLRRQSAAPPRRSAFSRQRLPRRSAGSGQGAPPGGGLGRRRARCPRRSS